LFYNINFFSIFIILDKSIDLLAFFDELLFKSNIIVPGIVLLITGLVSYFQFYYNLKYNNIIDEIENTDYKIRRKYNLWAIVYQIVSLIIIIGAIVFRFS
jgi:heme/copper-type cytochrome/quinol oxidase subunit 2